MSDTFLGYRRPDGSAGTRNHVLVIPGSSDPGHLTENIAAGALRLTPGDLARLEKVHHDQQ